MNLPAARWQDGLAEGRARLQARQVEDVEGKLRWLAAHLLSCGLMEIEHRRHETMTPTQRHAFESGLERLELGEPVQYVIGETDFLGFRIQCDARALIPRPETEQLALCAEAYLRTLPGRPIVVDAGTGSGCLACALALRLPQLQVRATDVSPGALELAAENARALGARVEFCQMDWLDGLPENSVDLVVSNPPYVATSVCDTLPPTVRLFEPRLALDGGADGLQLISRLVSSAARAMVDDGRLMMEIGDDQADAVRNLLCQTPHLHLIYLKCDYAGLARVAVAARRPRPGGSGAVPGLVPAKAFTAG